MATADDFDPWPALFCRHAKFQQFQHEALAWQHLCMARHFADWAENASMAARCPFNEFNGAAIPASGALAGPEPKAKRTATKSVQTKVTNVTKEVQTKVTTVTKDVQTKVTKVTTEVQTVALAASAAPVASVASVAPTMDQKQDFFRIIRELRLGRATEVVDYLSALVAKQKEVQTVSPLRAAAASLLTMDLNCQEPMILAKKMYDFIRLMATSTSEYPQYPSGILDLIVLCVAESYGCWDPHDFNVGLIAASGNDLPEHTKSRLCHAAYKTMRSNPDLGHMCFRWRKPRKGKRVKSQEVKCAK